MGNWNLAAPFLRMCVTRPGRVLKGLYRFTTEELCKEHVVKKYSLPNGLPTIDLLDLSPAFDDTIEHYTYLDGTSRVTDLALLRLLARRFPQGRYLEMGSWRGESLANVSTLVKEVISMSFSDADMRVAGMSESAVKSSHFFSKNLPNHTRIEHNTQTYDFSALQGTCDLIFVDADHHHKGVSVDTRNAFTLLRDDKSIIVWHDYGLGYEAVNWEVLRGILDGSTTEQRKHVYHVSNTLCAIYLPQPVRASFPAIGLPNKTFSVHINARPIE